MVHIEPRVRKDREWISRRVEPDVLRELHRLLLHVSKTTVVAGVMARQTVYLGLVWVLGLGGDPGRVQCDPKLGEVPRLITSRAATCIHVFSLPGVSVLSLAYPAPSPILHKFATLRRTTELIFFTFSSLPRRVLYTHGVNTYSHGVNDHSLLGSHAYRHFEGGVYFQPKLYILQSWSALSTLPKIFTFRNKYNQLTIHCPIPTSVLKVSQFGVNEVLGSNTWRGQLARSTRRHVSPGPRGPPQFLITTVRINNTRDYPIGEKFTFYLRKISYSVFVVGGHISHGNNDKGNVFTVPSNKYAEFNMFLDHPWSHWRCSNSHYYEL
ncbi:hypothetical protein Scep_025776 [Stephania cephalantha]|uniref:Uncharacterized protein n=1 Tax=Stephania cephalantha TaxID=152367 RepID=A0AAP0EP38_9MAGN